MFHDDPHTAADGTTGEGDESLGCFAGDYAFNDFHAGQIAVTFRGVCARTDRAVMGQKQHAAAVIMVNNEDALPPYENAIRGVTIPFIGVDGSDADRFTTDDGESITIRSAGIAHQRWLQGHRELLVGRAAQRRQWRQAGRQRAGCLDLLRGWRHDRPGQEPVGYVHGLAGDGGCRGARPAGASRAGIARAIKAAIVSTASAGKVDPYDLRSAGAGLAQPRKAVDTVAFVYTDPGSSSLAFGFQEAGKVPGSSNAITETRRMTIRNTSKRSIRYDLSNSFNGNARGVEVNISPSSVSVPANSKASVNVRITLAESAVSALPAAAPNHAPNLAVDDFGSFYTPVTTVRGAIIAKPRSSGTGVYALRVPWLVAPKGLSDVRVNGSRAPYTGSGSTKTSSIRFQNFGLHKGIVDVYAWGLTDDREDVGEVDLRAAGVQSLATSVCTGVADPSDRCLVFAINTWQPWSNAAANEFDVLVDVDKDGTEDYVLFSADDGLVFTGEPNGITDAFVVDLHSNEPIDVFDTVVSADGSTILLPALASDFGLAKDGPASFEYFVASFAYLSDNLFTDVMHTGDSARRPSENARFNPFSPSLSTGYFKSLCGGQDDHHPAHGAHLDVPLPAGPEGLAGGDAGRQ